MSFFNQQLHKIEKPPPGWYCVRPNCSSPLQRCAGRVPGLQSTLPFLHANDKQSRPCPLRNTSITVFAAPTYVACTRN